MNKQEPRPPSAASAELVLTELARSAQRGERCLWVTEIATLSGLSLRDAVALVEHLYRAGLAQPYFSDKEARRAATCITKLGLTHAAALRSQRPTNPGKQLENHPA